MSTFLTRISARAREVLNSFGEKSAVPFEDFVNKIVEVGGMGARVVKEYPDIRKFIHPKTLDLKQVLEEAFFNAVKMGHSYVGTEHLLLALLIKSGYKNTHDVSTEVEKVNSLPVLLKNIKGSGKLVHLSAYGVDLTKKYIFYPKEKFVERAELDKIFTILLQKHNPNVLLVGGEGSGKASLAETLARKIAYMDAPRDFMGAYVIDFNFSGFLSSAPFGVVAYESMLKDLAGEISALGNCIIVIKRLPALIVALAFKQFVEYLNAAGARFVVCTEDGAELEDLFSAFSVVEVAEPSRKTAVEILKMEAQKLEQYFLTKISNEIINYVYLKAKDEIKDQVFPQKGIYLLDVACSIASFEDTKIPKMLNKLMERHSELATRLEQALVDKSYDKAAKTSGSIKRLELRVKKVIDETKMEMRELKKSDVDKALKEFKDNDGSEYKIGLKKLSDLEKRLNQRIVGQDKAVEIVAKALVRSQMGLRPKNKPVGNFLFLGPTGVGKTELAKVLAQEAFGEGSLIRLDMSDFSEKHTVARLVGAPPGYVGYNEGGELTVKIAKKPQSVVLFDEVEKAHPEVMNILLQIMEEGQLSDMRGELFNFSKAVIILTSNLGTESIHKRDIGYGGGVKSGKEVEGRVMQSVRSFIKPELLNRFDEIVTFRQLEKSDSVKILDLLLKEVQASLKERGIGFKVSPEVKELLLEKGFSTEFGARALRRTVEKELLDRIAAYLLDKDGTESGSIIHAVVDKGGIIVKN